MGLKMKVEAHLHFFAHIIIYDNFKLLCNRKGVTVNCMSLSFHVRHDKEKHTHRSLSRTVHVNPETACSHRERLKIQVISQKRTFVAIFNHNRGGRSK